MPVFAVVLVLWGCSPEREKLMDEIEGTVDLRSAYMANWSPPSAIGSYDRYYAWAQKGRTVEAVYIQADGKAGRLWVSSMDKLPVRFDGGCSFIRIRYELRARRSEVICNGGA
jgi:hypothetical protein